MYNIEIYNGHIWLIADKVESKDDEKMFSLEVEQEEFSTHKKYWSSTEARTFLRNSFYDPLRSRVSIKVYEGDVLLQTHEVSFGGKNIVFSFPTDIHNGGLGDTFTILNALRRFKEIHGCNILVHTMQLNELLSELTDDFIFVDIVQTQDISLVENRYILSSNSQVITNVDYHFNLHFSLDVDEYRVISLADGWMKKLNISAHDILKPTIKELSPIEESIPKPYICFSEFASMISKHWHNENGWQSVVDHFTNKGYTMVSISSEKTNLNNVYDLSGDSYSLLHKFRTLKDCEFYIGLDSGISWMANFLGKYCYVIHGSTPEELVFQDNVTRIGLSSDDYCRSCHNDTSVLWDKPLLNTCFYRKDFECTRLLTSDMVINKIEGNM